MTSTVSTREAIAFGAWIAWVGSTVAFVVSASLGVPRLVTIPLAVVMIGAPSFGAYVQRRESSRRGAALASTAASFVSAFVLLALAIAVGVTVLIAIAGLTGPVYDEDVVLLAVCWGVLGLVWLGERALRRIGGDA